MFLYYVNMYCWEEIIVKDPINFVLEKKSTYNSIWLYLLFNMRHALLDFILGHTVGILTKQEWNGRI